MGVVWVVSRWKCPAPIVFCHATHENGGRQGEDGVWGLADSFLVVWIPERP